MASLEPADLSVGRHELHCVVTAEGTVVFDNTIHFFIG